MSRVRWFFGFTGTVTVVLVALLVWAGGEERRWRAGELPRLRHMVTRLGLTDLALWTEARYARHPSQTDRFSAFQDFPAAPEHFPAGSIVPPPPALGASQGMDESP